MTSLPSTDRVPASESGRTRLRRTIWLSGIAVIGLGAALVLGGADTAAAAYYYGGGYYGYGYGYGYRAARTERPYAVRKSRAAKKSKKSRDVEAKKDAPARPIKGPLTVVVSIGEQRVRVYDQTSQIAESPTSTGTRAFPTPMGVFTVIQKNRYHYSNLYNGAPMPYMQRLTWSGTAMHTGVLPGYPASHGCIRLPNSFAARMWSMTKLGTRVVVARNGVHPVEITHAKLDSLKRKPADPPVAEGAAGKTAANEGPVTDGFSTPMPNLRSAITPSATPFASEPGLVPPPATPISSEPSTQIMTPMPAPEPSVAAPSPKPLKPGPVAIFISKKEGKLFVRKGFEPVFDMPVKIDRPEAPLGTHIYTATEAPEDALTMRWMALSLPAEARAEPRAQKQSRAERRGKKAVETQVVAAPVGPSASASEALDRVELPPEAIERLAELLSQGASLIISDKGLGHQTGKGTEFIVLSR